MCPSDRKAPGTPCATGLPPTDGAHVSHLSGLQANDHTCDGLLHAATTHALYEMPSRVFCHLWAQSTWPHLALLRSLPGEGTNRETKAQGQILLAPKTPLSSGLRQTSEALLLLQPSLCLGHRSAPAELVPTTGPGPKANPPHCCSHLPLPLASPVPPPGLGPTVRRLPRPLHTSLSRKARGGKRRGPRTSKSGEQARGWPEGTGGQVP